MKKDVAISVSDSILFICVALLFLLYIPSALDPTQHVRWIAFSLACTVLLYKSKSEINSHHFFSALLVLILIFVTSWFTSINKALFFTQFIKLTTFFIATILLIKIVRDERSFWAISSALLFVETIILLQFIYSLIIHYDVLFPLNPIAMNIANAHFMNKNLLASFLFLMILYKSFIYFHLKKHLGFVLVLCVFDLFAIALLQTRLVWVLCIVFIPILIFILLQNFQETINEKKIFVCLLAIILTSLFIIFVSGFADIFLQRIKDLVFYQDIRLDLNSSKERFFLLKRTVDLIIEYPFGVGLGNWQIYFPANGIANTNWEQGLVTVTVAHTDLLSIIAQLGWITILLIIAWLLFNYKLTFSDLFKNIKKENKNKLMLVIIFACVLLSLFDFAFARAEHLFLLSVFVAILYNQIGLLLFEKRNLFFSNSLKLKTTFPTYVLVFLFILIHLVRLNSSLSANNLERFKVEKNWKKLKESATQSDNYLYSVTDLGLPVVWYKGYANFNLNNVNDAYLNFCDAKGVSPNDINVLSNLGVSAAAIGKKDVAIESYNAALKISPRFNTALLNRAIYYYNQKNYVCMISDLNKIKDEKLLMDNAYAINVMKLKMAK